MPSEKTKKINSLLSEQKKLLEALCSEMDSFDENELACANEALRAELESVLEENSQLKQSNKELSADLEKLRSALFVRLANEKLAAFDRVQRKIDSIYYTDSNQTESRLEQHKRDCAQKICELTEKINSHADAQYDDILSRLRLLEEELEARHKSILEEKAKKDGILRRDIDAQSDKLKNEPLAEAEKKLALKSKSLEAFVGLNVLSKAGIVLFLIGIIALGRFAYTSLPDLFKSLMIHLLGILLASIGAVFNKKEKNVFSIALISGGVAVSYAAIATSYFALEVYSAPIAFLLCMAVTVASAALSFRLDSQVICAFGTVGGYLPLVVTYMAGFGYAVVNRSFLPVSCVYFCLHAAIILFMTYNKKWNTAQYIGYTFNLAAIAGVTKCALALKSIPSFGFSTAVAFAFCATSFVIYMLMPAIKIIHGKKLEISDISLLTLNTVSGAVSTTLTVMYCFEKEWLVGTVFLVFAAVYAVLLVLHKSNNESDLSKPTNAVLAVFCFIFSLLVVPFIFGFDYAALAWSAQGAVIAAYATELKNKAAERTGRICILISLLIHIFICTNNYASAYSTVSIATFSVILLSLWGYIIKAFSHLQAIGTSEKIYQIICGCYSAVYLCIIYNRIQQLPFIIRHSYFTDISFYVLSALLLSIVIESGKFKSKISELFCCAARIMIFGATLFAVNLGNNYKEIYDFYFSNSHSPVFKAVNLVLLLSVNIITVLLLARSSGNLISRFSLNAWIYTAVISASVLILSTSMLISQFGVPFKSVLISAIYIAVSCLMLFLGFRRNYTVVRSGGLVLILCALAKLCFIDTFALDTAWKIISYFAFGAILIVISYFYNRFSKKATEETIAASKGETQD